MRNVSQPWFDLIEYWFGRIGPSQPYQSFRPIQKWNKLTFESTNLFVLTIRVSFTKLWCHIPPHAPSRATYNRCVRSMRSHAPQASLEEDDEWASLAHVFTRQRQHHVISHVSKRIFQKYSLYLVNYTFSPWNFIKLWFSPWILENYILVPEVS